MRSILQDIRHGLRALLADRGYTGLAVSCLALGIGLNTMVFTLVSAVLLQPPPLPNVERLVTVHEVSERDPAARTGMSLATFRALRTAASDVIELAALQPRGFAIAATAPAERVAGAYVSGNLFATLGLQPLAGRDLSSTDDRRGADPVVLLGESLWRDRFGGDLSLIGRAVAIDGASYTVIGIMPRTSQPTLPTALQNARLWLPLEPALRDDDRAAPSLVIYGRLAPNVAADAAASQLTAALQTSATSVEREGQRIVIDTFARSLSPSSRSMLAVTIGAVVFVLAIACANVANLMLARGLGRRREIAVRIALGASRWRIVRQLLVESLAIGVASVPPGLLVAALGIELIVRHAPEQAQGLTLPFDVPVLAFTLGLALLVSVLFGLAPALHAVRDAGHAALGTAPGALPGRPQRRLRSTLIACEIALSVMLLIGAALFMRSFFHLLRLDTAFDPAPLLTLRLQASTQGDRDRRIEDVLTRLAALPEIVAATATTATPLRDGGTRTTARVAMDAPVAAGSPPVFLQGITATYFDTLALPLVRGRAFSIAEVAASAPLAIINERMARRFWPDTDPLGQQVHLDDATGGSWYTVVGVARDLSNWDISDRPQAAVYLPLSRVPMDAPRLLLRGAGDPLALVPTIRDAIAALDPALAVFDVATMNAVRRNAFWRQELLGLLFTVFGALALVLAAAGLYGVLAHLAAQRVREIGIRVALGATHRDVAHLILRQGLLLVAAGVTLGMAGGAAVQRIAQRLVFDADATSVPIVVGAAVLVAAIGLAASYVPARRAARGDPNAVLKA